MVLRPNASRWKASAAHSPPPTDALKPRLGARTGKRGNRRVVGEAPPHFILSQQRDAEIAANSESLAIGTQTHGRAIDRAVARIENRAVLVGEPVSAHAFDESQSEHRRVLLFALALGAAPLLSVFTARLWKNLDDAGRHSLRPRQGHYPCRPRQAAEVEGDIFHRSLSIDENSQFEGSSRRVENPTDPSPSVDAKDAQKKDKQSPAPAPLPSTDAELTVWAEAPEDSTTAVCILPGTELAFSEDVKCASFRLFGYKAEIINFRTAI